MLGLAGAAGGGVLGSALGQVGDALSMPRRALWRALGLPETGSELVSNTLGLDPGGFGATALGMGAEILGDPLTWAGALAGGPLAKLAYSPWAKDAQIAGMLGDVRAGIGAADAALAARSGVEAQVIQKEIQAAQRLGQLDVPGIAAGETVAFPNSAPGAIDRAVARGVGFPLDSVPVAGREHRLPMAFHGREIPAAAGFEANPVQLRKPALGHMDGSGPALNPSYDMGVAPRPLTDFDRQFLRNYSGQTLGGPLEMSDLERRAALEALGRQVGANANAAAPMPTLGQAAEGNPLLAELLGGRSLPYDLPLPAARSAMSNEAAQLDQLLRSRMMTPRDWAMVGGAGLGSVGLGAYLGGR